jgi:diaminohydroxyphosphoribosylaminopyrimidine deaminase/5-amino-6-(5-phosphoribosylamino)uracil reductase
MNEATNQSMMRRAIELAMRGRGLVEPNPMVGCVIVKDGRVIGEGFHQKYGQAHAEPNALAACSKSPEGATAYVTLEPCCHINKQTPPCVPRLIAAKLARVVVGCLDPNPQVNGQGIAQLRQAGIEVVTGVLEDECRQLIAPFVARTLHRRPYITLKWAQSADGKIAGANGKPIQISNESSQKIVHELRARCDAIAVGINTVLSDDPLLTIRHAQALRPMSRYVLDRQLRIPQKSRLVQTARHTPLLGICRFARQPGTKTIGSRSHLRGKIDRPGQTLASPKFRARACRAGANFGGRNACRKSRRPRLDFPLAEVDCRRKCAVGFRVAGLFSRCRPIGY